MVKIAALLFILSAFQIGAQPIDDIVTDRPDQTESALTVPKGMLQAELGASIEKVMEFKSLTGKYSVFNHSYPSLLLRYGLTRRVELRLGAEFLQEKLSNVENASTNKSGLSPLTIGTKIKLFDKRRARPEAAFLFHLNIPLNTEGYFQSRYIGTDFRLSVAHSLGNRFSLSYNLGGEWDGNSPQATGIYTVSLGISIIKNFSGFVESYGFLTQGETPDHRVDGGLTYLFAKNIQADISGGVGITDKSPDFFMGAGISFRFPE